MTCENFPSRLKTSWATPFILPRPAAKPLKGFTGAGVLEVVEDHMGDTYRAVYTVRFADAVYVLHAFQKKSKSGIATPQRDIDLIKTRLQRAQEHHTGKKG
jgi:phage-related protein